MRKIALFVALCISAQMSALSAGGGASSGGEYVGGDVFFHTLRHSPEILKGAKALNVWNKTVPAVGLEIKCGKDQYASYKFSNSVAVVQHADSRAKIDEFRQQKTNALNVPGNREPSVSHLSMEIENGRFEFASKELRASSTFKVKTHAGVFDVRSKMFIIDDAGDSVLIYVLEGMARFHSADGKSDFLRAGQKAIAKKSASGKIFPLAIEQMGITEESEAISRLSACRQIVESVVFERGADGNIGARRAIYKEYFANPPSYIHRK